jgi:GIY-YIG catalytic domain
MYTVYKITNLLNDKIYIGVHKTNDPYDSYYGSGVAIKESIKKHGKSNFKKEVLLITEDKSEAYLYERSLTKDFNSNKNYNLKLGGVGGWSPAACINGGKKSSGSNGGKKTSQLKVGIHGLSSKEKALCGSLGGKANKGKTKSLEHRRLISEALKKKKLLRV